MSFKAPEPIPVKKVIQTQAPSPIKTKKIIAEIKAEKYIPKQNIKPKLKPEPINKITKKIAPPKKIIPIAAKKEISIENKIIKTTKNKENPLRTAPHISNKKAVEGLTAEIKEASYRRQTPPVYPRRALELGQQGNVILHALIKPDGFPSELKVEDSSGHSLLDKAALAAVRKWEFEPVDNNGTTIASWVRVPIEFVIQ